ncbi:hypothetical protein WKW77_05725 [Variovorax ureilyticus]|uniref:Uncharacterized protein n=1 Tax=Variovorax ureilyticus TaxID=1836198 RepID=A0ABU8VC05_9BURK
MRGALHSHFVSWQEAESAARAAEQSIFQRACRVEGDDLATVAELAYARSLRSRASKLLRIYLGEVRIRSAALKWR